MATITLATNALTTLARVKEDLNIETCQGDDEQKLLRLINAASGFIERTADRVFYRDTAIVEKAKGYGFTAMAVKRAPINSITSITYNGATVDSDDYEVDGDGSEGLIFKVGGWNWTAQNFVDASRTVIPGTERPLYTVTYDGGWYTPAQEDTTPANTRALPWDLEDAAIELIRAKWYGKNRDPSVKSERLLSWSASYFDTVAPAAMGVIRSYKRLG